MMFSFRLHELTALRAPVRWVAVGLFQFGLFVCLLSTVRAGDLPESGYSPSDGGPYDIPGGLGIEYFLGEWKWGSASANGPISIDRSEISHPWSNDPRSVRPYRVLFEGRDYVLIVYKLTGYGGGVWTKFGAFTLANREQTIPGYLNKMHFLFHACTDKDFNSGEPFEWPKSQLITEFLGECGAKRVEGEDRLLFNRPWSAVRYVREMPKYGYPLED